MKKLIVLFLLVAFLLTLIGLIGCDDSPSDPGPDPGQSNKFSGTFFRDYEKVSSVEWGPTGEKMGTSTDFFQETFALVQNGTSLSGNFTRSHSWTYTGKPHTSEGPQPGTITKSCCTAESTVPVSGTVQGNSAEISWEKKLGQGCTGAEGCTCPIFHTACTCALTLDNGGDVLQFDCQCAETFYDEGTSRSYEATRQ